MKSDQPCVTGILPRPGKKLVGKHVEYYLEGQNRAYVTVPHGGVRTHRGQVQQECKKNVPVSAVPEQRDGRGVPVRARGLRGRRDRHGRRGRNRGRRSRRRHHDCDRRLQQQQRRPTTTIASSVNTTTTRPRCRRPLMTTTTLCQGEPRAERRAQDRAGSSSGSRPSHRHLRHVREQRSRARALSFFFTFGDGGRGFRLVYPDHTPTRRRSVPTTGDVSARQDLYV